MSALSGINPLSVERARFRRRMAEQLFALTPQKVGDQRHSAEGLGAPLYNEAKRRPRCPGVGRHCEFRSLAEREPKDVLGLGLTVSQWRETPDFSFLRPILTRKEISALQLCKTGGTPREGRLSRQRTIAWQMLDALEAMYLDHLDAQLFCLYHPVDRRYASDVRKALDALRAKLQSDKVLIRGLQSNIARFDPNCTRHVATLARNRGKLNELAMNGGSDGAVAARLLDILEEVEANEQDCQEAYVANCEAGDRTKLVQQYGLEVYFRTVNRRWHPRQLYRMRAFATAARTVVIGVRTLRPDLRANVCWEHASQIIDAYFPEGWEKPEPSGMNLREKVVRKLCPRASKEPTQNQPPLAKGRRDRSPTTNTKAKRSSQMPRIGREGRIISPTMQEREYLMKRMRELELI